ncbi:MAG: hypothetical protein KBC16_01945 [Candidatus Pacebacteria bacterium]|nr:hypothetical protein [Candidatus Paceibacterota bacterium]
MYEIEHRALLTEEKYKELDEKLRADAECLGEDDKDVAYFIFPDKLLKVVKNISKGTAKLSLKLNTLGSGSSFREIEVDFKDSQFESLKELCHAVSTPDQVIEGTQKRTNFMFKGVEIALKWSEDWGYHAEFEIVIDSLASKDDADTTITNVANSLDITLMTDEEVKEFSDKVRAQKKSA